MTERLITSSVLILAVFLLRGLFRKNLSRRMQYALWGLVLLRLLVPFQLPAADFSILTSVQPVQAAVEQRLEASRSAAPTGDVLQSGGGTVQMPGPPDGSGTVAAPTAPDSAPPAPAGALSAETLLSLVHRTGAVMAAAWFLLVNLRFWRLLRRRRVPYPVEGYTRRVFLVEEGLPSPCLFGLLRPAVYLTPAAASPERIGCVLAHEETHARHLDPLWSLLRCVCLTVYWFDPLVWAAAAASRTDCELACDEGALARLGEERRITYGQTLLALVPVRRGPANPFLTATTMAAGKKQLKDRITRIAQKPRQLAAAAAAAAVLAGVVSACAFTGANPPASVTPPPSLLRVDWGTPEAVLSLADAQPYTPEPFSVEIITDWTGDRVLYGPYGGQADPPPEEQPYVIYELISYETNTRHFAAADSRLERPEYRCFLTMPLENFIGGGSFEGELFGRSGWINAITYRSEEGALLTDYVCLGEDGAPIRLVQVVSDMSETFHLDCNQDGAAEVVAPGRLFFQREGAVYQADIPALWKEAYPDYTLEWSRWDAGTDMLKATGYFTGADGVFRSWTRYLRFDGENLEVFRDPRTMEDHVMSDIQPLLVPREVTDKAKELTLAAFPRPGDVLGTYPGGAPILAAAEYDDWRVESIDGPEEIRVGGITLRVYRYNYEYHTTTPERVLLAGGMYITEDDWVMPGYPDCDYLFFRVEENGSLTFLWHEMSNDTGPEEMAGQGLYRLGLLDGDPQYQVQSLWGYLTAGDDEVTLSLTTADGTGGGVYSTAVSRGYNMPGDISSYFRWEALEEVPAAQLENTGVLTVSRGENALTFYEGPRLVEYQRGGDRRWYRAEQDVTDDIFAGELFPLIRQWYDEIEMEALRVETTLPDDSRRDRKSVV